MKETNVVNVDLVGVAHEKIEVESHDKLKTLYEDWKERTHKKWQSDLYVSDTTFEACFIVYRESMPHIMFYAQE